MNGQEDSSGIKQALLLRSMLWPSAAQDSSTLPQVEAATVAGKLAILCEKPLATTVEEALRVLREARCRIGFEE